MQTENRRPISLMNTGEKELVLGQISISLSIERTENGKCVHTIQVNVTHTHVCEHMHVKCLT
jgi:hypothetical protein